MPSDSEIDYLSRRATEELGRAEASENATAIHIHQQLAALYALRVAELMALTGTAIVPRTAPPERDAV